MTRKSNHICQRQIKIIKTLQGKQEGVCILGMDDFAPEEIQEIINYLNQATFETYMQRSAILNDLNNIT